MRRCALRSHTGGECGAMLTRTVSHILTQIHWRRVVCDSCTLTSLTSPVALFARATSHRDLESGSRVRPGCWAGNSSSPPNPSHGRWPAAQAQSRPARTPPNAPRGRAGSHTFIEISGGRARGSPSVSKGAECMLASDPSTCVLPPSQGSSQQHGEPRHRASCA